MIVAGALTRTKRVSFGKTLVLRKEVLPQKTLAGFLTYGNSVKAFSIESLVASMRSINGNTEF